MNYNGFAFGSEAERVASESLATFYVVRIYKLAKISHCIQKNIAWYIYVMRVKERCVNIIRVGLRINNLSDWFISVKISLFCYFFNISE